MAIRLTKPWQKLTADAIRALPGQLGVYQLGDAAGRVLYIGYAGGRSLFGLRSAIEEARARLGAAASHFRYEVNQQYMSRYEELLMLHIADHGALPPEHRDTPRTLGRLSPVAAGKDDGSRAQ
jgi:hypothetical protein